MKKTSLVFAALVGAATIIPHISLAHSSSGHWQLVQSNPFPDSVTQVVAGPGSLVYMATSDKGVFKSTDEGENWTQINTGLFGGLGVTMLALGPKGDLLGRDDRNQVLYSKDGYSWASGWAPWYWIYPGAQLTAFAFDSFGTAYFGTVGAGIYRMDSLEKWVQVVPPTLIPGVQSMIFDGENQLIVHYDKLYRLKSDFTAIDTSFAITAVRNTPVQLLRSTWGTVLIVSDTLFELQEQLRVVSIMPRSRVEDQMIVVDSTGILYSFSEPYVAWYGGPEESTDRGLTWHTHAFASVSQRPYDDAMFTEATNHGFVSASDGGAQVSVAFDGLAFTRMHELDSRIRITEIAVDGNGTIQAFDELSGIWSSPDHGRSWKLRMPKQNIQAKLLEDGKYYSVQSWPPLVSDDGGLTYKPVNVPAGVRGGFYASPSGSIWIYYGSAHYLRSLDGGSTWNEFAHFTDMPPPYFKSDSAAALGIVERGPYIWLATDNVIHLTSDDGHTWQVDTAHYIFNDIITGGKGYTLITHTSGQGVHWLSPWESPDSSWLQANGSYAVDQDGTMLQFAKSYYSSDPEVLIRESKSGVILDTLCVTPDSLSFSALVVDSVGHIFGASAMNQSPYGGLYRFVSANESVSTASPQSENEMAVSVSHEVLTIGSPFEIRSVQVIDVTGRSVLAIPGRNSMALSVSIASLPTGAYIVKVEDAAGAKVRKLTLMR